MPPILHLSLLPKRSRHSSKMGATELTPRRGTGQNPHDHRPTRDAAGSLRLYSVLLGRHRARPGTVRDPSILLAMSDAAESTRSYSGLLHQRRVRPGTVRNPSNRMTMPDAVVSPRPYSGLSCRHHARRGAVRDPNHHRQLIQRSFLVLVPGCRASAVLDEEPREMQLPISRRPM